MKKVENNNHSVDFQRIKDIKKFLKINTNTELSQILGLKSSQIFTDIKNGRCGISPSLAKKICDLYPNISYEWIMTGNGTITSGDNSQTITGNNNHHNSNSNIDSRLLKMLEDSQQERLKLLTIIENLTNK